jgi:hypothetical protein
MSDAIHAAEQRTGSMPVRYEDVQEEWDGAFKNDSKFRALKPARK